MKKFLSSILITLLLVTNTAVLKAPVAQAGLFDWPPTFDFQLPEFKLPEFSFLNGVDLLGGFEKIKNLVTGDQIDLRPILPFTIYPKESVFTNIIKNVPGLATDFIDKLNPYKAAASLARIVLKFARPYIEPAIKSILPKDFKGGVYKYLEDMKRILREANGYPIIKDVILPLWEFLVGPFDDLAGEILEIFAEEQMIFAEGDGSPGSEGEIVGGLPPVNVASPFVNQQPVGELIHISDVGVVKGWAVDPNDPNSPLNIRLSVREFGDVIVKAEFYPYDLNLSGKQAFFYRIPSAWRDGNYHYLKAFAIDINDASVEVELKESPKQFALYERGLGAIEELREIDKVVKGWAIDPDQEGSPAEVKFYLEDGTYLGNTYTNIARDDKRTWLDVRGDRYVSIPRREIGFQYQLDLNRLSDGKGHILKAYVVDKQDAGNSKETFIGEVRFMFPENLPIRFEKDPITIQQGRRLFNTVHGIGNKDHYIALYLDGKLIDIRTGKNVVSNYISEYWFSVKGDNSGSRTRSFDFDFLIHSETTVGEHTITLESQRSQWFGWIYSKSFKINVLPYKPLTFQTPDILTTEKEFEVKIINIPERIKLTGDNANIKITGISLGNYNGFYYMQGTYDTKQNEDGSVTMKVSIPREAGAIGKGPIWFYIGTEVKSNEASEELFGQTLFQGFNKDGIEPVFEPSCFNVISPALIMGGGAGKAVGNATGFSCFKNITVTVSGVNNGKNFSIVLPSDYYAGDTAKEIPPLAYSPKTVGWNGDIENFTLTTTQNWARDYTTVEEITVTIKDELGNTASAKVNLSSPYKIKVFPLKEGEELVPGASIRLGTSNFTPGNLVKVTIDGKSAKEFYLNGKQKDTWFLSDPLNLPAAIKPGIHTILLEDLTKVDEKGEAIYRAQSNFTIVGELEQKKPETPATVKVMPSTVKVGQTIDIMGENFSQNVLITIYLKPSASPDEQGIKLSGYDYTSGSSFSKGPVRIPEVATGKYIIVVTDIQGITASADLTIEDVEIPKLKPKPAPVPAPKPTPEPAPKPIPPPEPQPKIEPTPPVNLDPEVIPVKPPLEPESTPTPKQEEQKAPTCPNGFTYSPTFKTCLQDAPPASEFEGKPCDQNIPMYVQKGCIP